MDILRRCVVWLLIAAALWLLGGCAAKKSAKPGPKPTAFASADAKNVHDFMARYPAVVMSHDFKSMSQLYTEDARIVPLSGHYTRPIYGQALPRELERLVAKEREIDFRLVFYEPMHIEVGSDKAVVKVVAEVAWNEGGKPHHGVVECYFGLVRQPDLLWKIREVHAEPVKAGTALPAKPVEKKKSMEMIRFKHGVVKPKQVTPKPAEPAQQPAAPAGQDTGTTPGPIVPDVGDNPQPLF